MPKAPALTYWVAPFETAHDRAWINRCGQRAGQRLARFRIITQASLPGGRVSGWLHDHFTPGGIPLKYEAPPVIVCIARQTHSKPSC
ncbi:hypothetical protein FJZ55_02505 [Candidatus Woesearchaeota archaeon]|nr:hypothetical protein [Candidatus Woesearchaeota archaeon]